MLEYLNFKSRSAVIWSSNFRFYYTCKVFFIEHHNHYTVNLKTTTERKKIENDDGQIAQN